MIQPASRSTQRPHGTARRRATQSGVRRVGWRLGCGIDVTQLALGTVFG